MPQQPNIDGVLIQWGDRLKTATPRSAAALRSMLLVPVQ